MAATTFTYTPRMASAPRGLHAGLNVIPFDFNSGATKCGTLSDVILLGKLPNGALITDVNIRFGAQGSAATHFTLLALAVEAQGTYSTLATIAGSMTASTTAARFTFGEPVKISISDDRAVQYAVLALNCTTGASGTVSFSLQGNVKYLADGSTV